MAEEWGVVVLEVDAELAASFADAAESLEGPIRRLATAAILDAEVLTQCLSSVDSVETADGFVVLSYDCGEWVAFSEAMMKATPPTRYFARHHDEYGMTRLFSLNGAGGRLSEVIDEEADEIDDAIRLKIGRWVASLPEELITAVPSLNSYESEEYSTPTQAETLRAPRPQTNLKCIVLGKLSEAEVLQALDEEFHEFRLRETSGGTLIEWFPISANRESTVETLLQQLAQCTDDLIYGNNFFGHTSLPYRIFRCDRDGSEVLFDSSEYADEDLEALYDEPDEDLEHHVNWQALGLQSVVEIEAGLGLRAYYRQQLRRLRDQRAADLAMHQRIWDEHPGEQESLLQGRELIVYYQRQDLEQVERLVFSLQVKGMRKKTVERGLGFGGRNTLFAKSESRAVGAWLIDHVPELEHHRLVVDDDDESDAIVINLF